MRTLAIVSALLVTLAACSPIRTATPQATQAGQPPSMTASAPAAATQPSQAGTAAAPITLQVLSPQDSAVVNTPQVMVSGVSSAGAVISVNDDILLADAAGHFQATVALSEGLNLIEIIASDTSGTEISTELAVTYEP